MTLTLLASNFPCTSISTPLSNHGPALHTTPILATQPKPSCPCPSSSMKSRDYPFCNAYAAGDSVILRVNLRYTLWAS